LFPSTPLIGDQIYQWDAANGTWLLLGAATGVTAGTYGDATHVGQFTVDSVGRITFAQDIALAAGGTVTDVNAGTGLLGGTITTSGIISLDTAYTDGLYLSLAGGTMTGDITFSGTQTFPAQDLQTVTTAGATTTDTVTLGGLIASGLTYPTTDGASGDYLTTDGAGNLGWISPVTPSLQDVTNVGSSTTNSIAVAGLTASGLIYPAADGAAGDVMVTDGAGNLGWLQTLEVVSAPANSGIPGALGQVAISTGFFYFHDGTQWLQVAGSIF
jgi:hypothetical protein